MAEYYTVARGYAKAIYQEARQTNSMIEWGKLLQVLAIVANDADVLRLIENPKVSIKKIIQLFYDVAYSTLTNYLAPFEERAKNFITLLCKNKRLAVLPYIDELYQQLISQQEGMLKIEVLSALPLDETQQKKIHKALEKRFNINILIEYKIDASLIGGALIRSNNWVMDGSIKGKLARMMEKIQ